MGSDYNGFIKFMYTNAYKRIKGDVYFVPYSGFSELSRQHFSYAASRWNSKLPWDPVIYSLSSTHNLTNFTGGRHDIWSAFIHEIGHVLGLGHQDDVPSVMASNLPKDTERRELYTYDINLVRKIYS